MELIDHPVAFAQTLITKVALALDVGCLQFSGRDIRRPNTPPQPQSRAGSQCTPVNFLPFD